MSKFIIGVAPISPSGANLPSPGPAFLNDLRRGCSPLRTRRPHLWTSDLPTERNEAVRVCKNVCPFTAECNTYAERADERWGVWGGVVRSVDRSEPDDQPRTLQGVMAQDAVSNHHLFAKLTDEARAEAVRLGLAERKTFVDLARYWRVEMGYLQALVGYPVIDEQIIELYHADKSDAQIALTLGVSTTKVGKVRRDNNLPTKFGGCGHRRRVSA
jgi:hypothetical protein